MSNSSRIHVVTYLWGWTDTADKSGGARRVRARPGTGGRASCAFEGTCDPD